MCSTSSATERTVIAQGRAGRRALLAAALAGVVSLVPGRALLAHTPYRQWKVYRQRHLMIGASREDAESYPKAKEIQAFLETYLPEASARVARARTVRRLADLLATDQIPIVLLSTEDAVALERGGPPFRGPVEVRTLWRFGGHVMVVRPTFPRRMPGCSRGHFWNTARRSPDPSPAPAHAEVPLHEGTRIARDGGPMPSPPVDTLDESRDGTDHD